MGAIKNNEELLHAELVDVLQYDQNTGEFIWKKTLSARGPKGSVAGCVKRCSHSANYSQIHIKVFGSSYLAHRLAWFYFYKKWPDGEIDHINHNSLDNRIENLREVSRFENHKNTKKHKRNTSGVCGVSWYPQTNRWTAQITCDGTSYKLGYFKKFEDAVFARREAEKRLGFHENHGKELVDVVAPTKKKIVGVSVDGERWRAKIKIGKIYYLLGVFSDWFDAVCAVKSAENKYFTGVNNNGVVLPPPKRQPTRKGSGVKGVSFYSNFGKWCARISVPGEERKSVALGLYEKFEDAVAVRKQAEAELAQGIMPTAVRTRSDRRRGLRSERIPSCLQA